MSGTSRTDVHGSQGPLHAGSGPQNNYNAYYYRPPRRGASRPLAEDHLNRLSQRFVHPDGLGEARHILRKTGTVLLDGAPGSGRNAAARILLHELGGPGRLREVLPEDNDARTELDASHLGEGERLLLDLSEADPPTWEVLHKQLPGYHQTCRDHRARLAVIVPHRPVPLSHELDGHRGILTPPPVMSVLLSTLRQEGLPLDGPDEVPAEIRRYLTSVPALRDVARLAGLLARSRRARPRDGMDAWCTEALSVLTGLPKDLDSKHISQFGGQQRALLLTSAVLHGARPHAVYEACELLLDTLGHPVDERPALDRADLSVRLGEIAAELDSNGRVTFSPPDHAEAVRRYFWDFMPVMHRQLPRWVTKVVQCDALTDEDRDELISCFAEQRLHTGQGASLLPLARRWADQGNPALLQAAVQALGHGLEDLRTGQLFRRQVYAWSKEGDMSPGLRKALIAVSSGVIAERHPDQALVRLHHLTRRSGIRYCEAAQRLLRLASADRRLHRKMLERLADGLRDHEWDRDIELFHALTKPGLLTASAPGQLPLIRECDVRSWITKSWGVVFARSSAAVWSAHADRWLSAVDADTTADRLDVFLDVLVEAAASPLILAQLYVLSLRHACAARLQRKIDTAQGLRPVHRQP